MTRTLLFDGARGPTRFQLLWTALLTAGDGKGERTPVMIRKEARLQETLETISTASGNGSDPIPMRKLVGTPTLSITQEDYDLLLQYSEKAPWTPRASRDVVDLWDWLSAAEKKD